MRLRSRDWTRRVVNVLTLATPVGLALARSGHARLVPGPHGTWVATGYRSRFPAPRAPAVTIGDVVLLRLDDEHLARRPLLLHPRVAAQRPVGLLARAARLPRSPTAWPACVSWWKVRDFALANVFEVRAGLVDGGYLRAGESVSSGSRRPAPR